ncbi:uncharacterized protein SCHCODRAFT_02519496 [Schizophyllum commune H4-8]|nr:uncharacterized protein SCHCODRAFT_02519496 [Schizophyllum commune H4-8]KAI5885799.1 hypothetical protein SCHCODRAFT_02519496 [Schizophyllum commune H4-8]
MHSPSSEKSPIAMAAPLADSQGRPEAPAPSTTAQELAHLAREFLVVVLIAYAILSALLPALGYVLARLPAFAVPDAPSFAIDIAHVNLLRVVFVCTALVFAVYGAAVAAYFAARKYWCARRSVDLEKGSEEECASLLTRRGPIAL